MQTLPEENSTVAEVPFAWANLMYAKRSILQMLDEMPKLRDKVDKLLPVSKAKAKEWYDELLALRERLQSAIASCRPYLLEMELEQEAGWVSALCDAVESFAIMTPDYTKFVAGVKNIISRLPGDDCAEEEPEDGKKTNAAIIGRLMNNVKLGYYPTDLDHIDLIMNGIEFPEGVTTNLLDPCCGCGLALRRLATGNGCMTYGVELDEGRAELAGDQLHRIGVGSYFHSAISHEAFHLLLLNPPYLSVIREGGGNTRSEKMFLVDSMKHLVMGGLLVYIIPFYRITADVARILCDNFTSLSVYKFMGKEFERFRQVAIFGVRQKKCDGSGLVDAFLEKVASADIIPDLSELPENSYPLPTMTLPVNVFRGAVFNERELQRQLKASGSISRLMERSELDSREKRPLLPLNVGQIGLIAGSGMINGLAECDSPHVIKGRIVKETQRSVETSSGVSTVTETHTNRMLFNILTPSGLKSLT